MIKLWIKFIRAACLLKKQLSQIKKGFVWKELRQLFKSGTKNLTDLTVVGPFELLLRSASPSVHPTHMDLQSSSTIQLTHTPLEAQSRDLITCLYLFKIRLSEPNSIVINLFFWATMHVNVNFPPRLIKCLKHSEWKTTWY